MGNGNVWIKNIKTIYTGFEKIENAGIFVSEGKIERIISEKEQFEPSEGFEVIDANHEWNAMPGFIDGHIHGGYGVDVMDADVHSLQMLAEKLPSEGTTSYLATTITQSPEEIEKALLNVYSFENQAGTAEMMGVHLEGPFVEVSKAGAQPKEYIVQPDLDQFRHWQQISGNNIRTITMAPEHDANGEFIKYLHESGVNVSAGHTDASFSQMKTAVSQGVRQLTHLCNAMNGIHHRDIGAVGAAFQLEDLRAELITDGIHVVPEMMQLIYDSMGSERIIIITDAMRAKGLEDGDYELGGQPVTVKEGRATLANGSLAGSVLRMIDGVKNMLGLEGVSIEDVIQMASVNPAKQVGIFDQKGSIEVGKHADILLVNNELDIQYTICRGKTSYRK
ncbi:MULTISPECIES: N-acetylglucosamine-6-phosphate deacetylase [unclassified Oceanobacillus]|uniref:N-acetylglucosamine-6-phosphate deacetylase n=1 Tax=unclassified Oceanobacillus TaxID=2630292 RepID=UPI001BE52CE5|nr:MULTISPECIES: N-acetylglucosamine-6-phosphate deacetylase [unclassified Oceanobacillus]MBT2600541.1 N-acetylglucosamine-6-phosphate deacetylase [Oceanobacillus sp. ISL-74]MBT2650699.1 N-acetylglucosamine-6-phosphate deacetylase [Oceanobacillus sp. ISL-73]